MFLTAAQLEELTGYTQPAKQIRWLQLNRVRHFVRADGRPVVPQSSLDEPEPPRAEPDFAAVQRRH